jgi:hypothetical protein
MHIEREYPYRPRLPGILFGTLFFTAAAVALARTARTNTQGILIEGIIPLSPAQATVFYWVLFAFSVLTVGMGVAGLFHRATCRQRLAFTPEGILAPKSRWAREEVLIAYSSITHLERARLPSNQHLYVDHPGGRQIINAAMLPNTAAFEEICSLLGQRV